MSSLGIYPPKSHQKMSSDMTTVSISPSSTAIGFDMVNDKSE